MRRALAFNDTQIAELKRAASLLPPEARDSFLQQVAARLATVRRAPTNGDVQSTILALLADASIRVGEPVFCNDAEAARDSR